MQNDIKIMLTKV